MRIPSIAQCHGMRGKVPRRMALYARRGRLQHDLADLGEFAGPPLVAYVDLQPTEPGHAGRVDDPDHEVRVATAEAPSSATAAFVRRPASTPCSPFHASKMCNAQFCRSRWA